MKQFSKTLLIHLFLLIFILLVAGVKDVEGATYYSRQNGNWNSNASWSSTGSWGDPVGIGLYPKEGDVVLIDGGYTITVNITDAKCLTLKIGTDNNSTSKIAFNNNCSLEVTGDITLGSNGNRKGSIDMTAGGHLKIGGSLIVKQIGEWLPGTGTVEYNRLGDQTVGNFNYYNLILSGSSIKSISNVTVNGILSLEGSSTVSGTPAYGTNATLQYNGSVAQTTGTEFPSSFDGTGGVIINNSNGVILQAAKAIGSASKLNLISGKITTTTANLLTINNTINTAITGGSTSSYIDGPIKWALPPGLISGATYSFPVGKGGNYLPFTLVNPITGTGTVTAQVEAYNSNSGGSVDATLSSISSSEYWSLETVGNFTNSSLSIGRLTAIAPMDVIGGSTDLGGTYKSLAGTVGTNSILNSNVIGANRFFVLAQKKLPITTGIISGSPFCAGAAVSVPFTISGSFNAGNIFTAQLSNSSGSFASPVSIGTLTSTSGGNISATIPVWTTTGTGYRIRVVSSNPVIIGSVDASDLTINSIPTTPIVGTITQPTCALSTGSVVLSGLPSTTWTLTRSPGGIITTGTGTSTTISGLAPGNYTFSVSEGDNSGTFPGSGTGLTGSYFNNTALSGLAVSTTIDPTVNFNWAAGSPATGINTDGFSVRWKGMVQAGLTGTYTFTTRSDDGIRLWINNILIIDQWNDHSATDHSGTITLTAGQKYPIVMEFYEQGGDAVAQLSWTPPGQSSQIIPQTQLYPEVTTGCNSSESGNVVISAIPTPPSTPLASVTVQPTCTVPTGTIAVSSPLGSSYEYQLDAGAYQSSATFSGVAIGVHTIKVRLATSPTCISAESASLTVNAVPTPPSAPTANNVTVTYDGLAHTASATVSSGATVDWYTAATGGSLTTAPTGTSAGTYTAYAEARNIAGGCLSTTRTLVTLTINKKALTITANNKSKVYDGAVYSPFTVSYSGFVNGETASVLGGTLTFSGTATTAKNVGNGYLITPSGLTSSNYNVSFVNGTLNITARSITITSDAKTKVYGTTDPVLTYQITSGTIISGDLPTGALSRTIGETTGIYAINKNTLTYGSNYTETYVGSNLTISKAPLTVTADNKIKIYDGAVYSPFTVSYSGFVNGETASVLGGTLTFSGTAITAKNAGTGYVINPLGLTSANYNISYVSSTLNITHATVIPSVTASNKCYDGTTTASLNSQTLSGVYSPDNVTLLVGASNFNNALAGTGKTVTATGLSLSGTQASNYVLSSTTATCTADIIPVPVATFSYPNNPYCSNGSNAIPIFSGGGVAGTFSSTSGLVFVNTSTGEINVASSAPGTYTVINTINTCGPVIYSFIVTIAQDGYWTGARSTDWNDPANWDCNQLPTLSTDVVIANEKPRYPKLTSEVIGKAHNITIGSSASVTLEDGTLQIAGSISNSGTFTATNGTIEMAGSAAQTIGANVFNTNALMNLIINNPTGVTLQGPLNITGYLRPLSGDFNASGYLTLISTPTQTALIEGTETGRILGVVNIQRYLPSNFGYKYFSSPFQSANVGGFASVVNLTETFPTFYKYDENNSFKNPDNSLTYKSGWVKYTDPASLLIPMMGYAANLPATLPTNALPLTITLSGEVNNGPLSLLLENNNQEFTNGFNLVGNPYPSPIDWDATGWTKTNIDNAIYFFNAGNTDRYTGVYSSYVNGKSSDNVNGIIAAMQGFFVHVSKGSYPVKATLGATNSVRINNLNPVFKDASIDNRPTLHLKAGFEIKDAINDAAVIYFDPMADYDFEQDKDALKLNNTDILVPNIYTMSPEGSHLSINGLPFASDSLSVIPVGITTFSSGWINLRAENMDDFTFFEQVILKDALTGQFHDLRRSADVRFYLDKGTYDKRFSLLFSKEPINNGNPLAEKLFTLVRSGNAVLVKVNLAAKTKGNLVVTNLLGQTLLQKEVIAKETVEISHDLSTGVYVITLVSGNRSASEKILMRTDYE